MAISTISRLKASESHFVKLSAQVLVLGTLFWLAFLIFQNTQSNLQARGIESGFEFLNQEAGLPIGDSLLVYFPTDSYGWAFVNGVVNTVYVSFIAIVLSTILGVFVGVCRVSKNYIVKKLASVYVESLRNVPLLLILIFVYTVVLASLPHVRESIEISEHIRLNVRGLYLPKPLAGDGFSVLVFSLIVSLALFGILLKWGKNYSERTGHSLPTGRLALSIVIVLPTLTYLMLGNPITWDIPVEQGFNFAGGISLRPEFLALLVGLVLYTAAFIGENVRSGLQSVDKGQIEAAQALGLKSSYITTRILLPQALRVTIPATTNDYASLVKNSSLAVAIGYPDMVSIGGTIIGQNGQAIEIIAMWMAVYMAINLVISWLMNVLNAKVQLVER
ncbi:amino acid ABC transporter permease [Vibrio sp. vnigr-6D03]|uniref:amino acid ABC transporter permease n=1 Tax=Vibrio sp. vnigr-6D03 TaxID=2058088 RepID=UPI000C347702|nr:ABC transporter permease subunit [Vibrio sp. vnigr-6D03]PKF79670.1 amino acid ABC transporter permease [Vibrio sp. vnigr-6D03]